MSTHPSTQTTIESAKPIDHVLACISTLPDTPHSDIAEARSPQGRDGLPDILISNVQLRDLIDASVAAILRQEQDQPTLFMQASRLVRIGHDEHHRPVIVQMGVPEVKEVLTHAANFYRLRKCAGIDDEEGKISVSPPKEIAEQILARQIQEPYLPFAALDTIIETPVMRADGSILDQPGYDAKTRLYYAIAEGMGTCTIPYNPTPAQRDAARALLLSTFGEFPYAGEADKANTLALLLTPIVRPAIKRHVPMALIDAPKRGTGKGLLSDGVTITTTGNTAPVLTLSESPDELQKSITSLLIEGATMIIIDNIVERLQSKHLDAALTSDLWRGRILGVSKMALVPQRATWIATGNNIRLGGDLARRCYRIRLDAKVSKPDKRNDFTHSDLATWIKDHRAELVSALLTLARAWFAAGKPQDEHLPAMGTFTGWVKIIGGILKHAGVPGFLANLDELQEQSDEDSAQWEAFLHVWHTRWASAWMTTADMSKALFENERAGGCEDNAHHAFFDALPDTLQIALKEKPMSFKVRLGRALEKRVDTCFGEENFRLEKNLEKHSKKIRWHVLRGVAEGSFQLHEEKNKDYFSVPNTDTFPLPLDGIHPPQPPAQDHDAERQKRRDSSTGGLVGSHHQGKVPKTDQKTKKSDQPSAQEMASTIVTEEREVFTL